MSESIAPTSRGAGPSTAGGADPSPDEGAPRPPPAAPLNRVDEEWLLSQPRAELETICDELGVASEGTTEQLAGRIIDALEERGEVLAAALLEKDARLVSLEAELEAQYLIPPDPTTHV